MLGYTHFAGSFFTFDQRAAAARRDCFLRCSGVIVVRRAFPPLRPIFARYSFMPSTMAILARFFGIDAKRLGSN